MTRPSRSVGRRSVVCDDHPSRPTRSISYLDFEGLIPASRNIYLRFKGLPKHDTASIKRQTPLESCGLGPWATWPSTSRNEDRCFPPVESTSRNEDSGPIRHNRGKSGSAAHDQGEQASLVRLAGERGAAVGVPQRILQRAHAVAHGAPAVGERGLAFAVGGAQRGKLFVFIQVLGGGVDARASSRRCCRREHPPWRAPCGRPWRCRCRGLRIASR